MYSTVVSLAETPKGPRIYLQGKWLLRSGFEPASSYEVEIGQDRLTLRLSDKGIRRVSGKQNQTIPIIDIQNQTLQEAFKKVTKLQVVARDHTITITPAHTAQMIAERSNNKSMTEGSLFSGGGLLTEAAAQLGFKPQFAVELEPQYAEVYAANHESSDIFNMSVEEVSFETLRAYAPLRLMTCGIPCTPFAQCRTLNRGGQEKRDHSLPPEAHEEGDLTFFALRAIEAANPSLICIEESPNYLKSSSSFILQSVLRRWGYNVEARIISPVDYGELQVRKRAVIIARGDGRPVQWPSPTPSGLRTLGEILDPAEEVESLWFDRSSKGWIFDHWERQTAKGNGFASQIVTAESTSVGTVKRRYMAGQGDNPCVKHPTREGVYRFFTLNELKRLMTLPDSYDLGDVKTTSGEILGQGVVVSSLKKVLEANMGLETTQAKVVQITEQATTPVQVELPGLPEPSPPSGQLDLFCFMVPEEPMADARLF